MRIPVVPLSKELPFMRRSSSDCSSNFDESGLLDQDGFVAGGLSTVSVLTFEQRQIANLVAAAVNHRRRRRPRQIARSIRERYSTFEEAFLLDAVNYAHALNEMLRHQRRLAAQGGSASAERSLRQRCIACACRIFHILLVGCLRSQPLTAGQEEPPAAAATSPPRLATSEESVPPPNTPSSEAGADHVNPTLAPAAIPGDVSPALSAALEDAEPRIDSLRPLLYRALYPISPKVDETGSRAQLLEGFMLRVLKIVAGIVLFADHATTRAAVECCFAMVHMHLAASLTTEQAYLMREITVLMTQRLAAHTARYTQAFHRLQQHVARVVYETQTLLSVADATLSSGSPRRSEDGAEDDSNEADAR